jgi:hypothetical protein
MPLTLRPAPLAASLALAFALASAPAMAERLAVAVSHALDIARPAETIVIPWSEINKALPGALVQHIAVKDAAGRVLPHQVTNVAPMAHDTQNQGIAYGDLIFQYDFAAGEHKASFSIEKIEELAPVFPTKAFARYVPERLDDFAWENDKIAHRTYGPALAEPAPAGSDKEVLVTSGIDNWLKRVDYPIVDRWYNKGHDHYHKDEGEGIDMYNVGKMRGTGGTGIWDGRALYTGANYKSWKVLANGPVRAIFELSYDAWDAGGVKVSEVKRYTVDAGHYFDQVDSTFSFTGAPELTVAVGLGKEPTDKGQANGYLFTQVATDPSMLQWVTTRSQGSLATAIIIPAALPQPYAEDKLNQLMLAKVSSGKPLRFYAGAGWSKAGAFRSKDEWQGYVAATAARIKSPVQVTLTTAP